MTKTAAIKGTSKGEIYNLGLMRPNVTNNGRRDDSPNIEKADIVKAIDIVGHLSAGGALSIVPIRCKITDNESCTKKG